MKSKLRYFTFVCMILLVTGCTKVNETMTIRLDKKMNLELLFAAPKETSFMSQINFNDKIKLEERGYKVKDYEKDNQVGIILTKKFKSIDKYSIKRTNPITIANIITEENPTMFTIKKSFFKNTYTLILNKSNIKNQAESFKKIVNMDLNAFTQNKDLDAKFVLNLPYKNVENNATLVEKDGKKLTWDLVSSGENMTVTFVVYNLLNVGVIFSSVLIMTIITISTLYTRATNRRLLAEYRTRKAVSPQQYTYEAVKQRERERLYGKDSKEEKTTEEQKVSEEKKVELISLDKMPDDLEPIDEAEKEEE